jgi:outer membrane protein TolC/ABC-type uncharacterized transport system substrate-binding protein
MKKMILSLLYLLMVTPLCNASTLPIINVVTVVDSEDLPYIQMQEQLSEELKSMMLGAFTIHFSKRINTDWSASRAKEALQKLQNDPGTDIVLVLGLVSAQESFKYKNLKKPTFAPYLLHLQNYAMEMKKSSGRSNFNYLAFGPSLGDALNDFLSVTNFSKVTLLTDSKFSPLFTKVSESMQAQAAKKGIQLNTVVLASQNKNFLEAIPTDTKAVMLTPLPNLEADVKTSLIKYLIENRIPSYAFAHDITVDDGIMMSSYSSDNISRRIRQTALNIQSFIQGERPETLPVLFEEKRRLSINLSTTNAIGIYPSFEVLSRARILGGNDKAVDNPLSLRDVAKLAVQRNLHIIVGELAVKSEDAKIKEVRSVLFPQISGNLSYIQQNSDNVYVENGFYAEKSSSGAIRLQQLLFSEKALAALEIQKKMKSAAQAQQRTLELDIVERATIQFLNILIAQTHLTIEQENLKLTQANMEFSKGRVDAGISDMSDVYHWESRIATSYQRVLEAKAAVEKTQDALNLILNRPIAQRIKTIPATLEDPGLLINNKPLLTLISNEKEYRMVNDFFVEEGFKSAPEISLFDSRISAQTRQLKSDKLAYLVPDIALTSELSRVFDEQRIPLAGFNLEDQTNWQAGIVLSLPLFEGGAKGARVSRSQLGLKQLKVSREEQQHVIEQQIRQDLHAIRASYPSIELSRNAADAANKSFKLVRENYAEGTRPMTDLLVAQNANILAEQTSANAVYRFFIDLMYLQRDIGQFDFFMDEPEQTSLINRLTSRIKSGSDTSPEPIKASQ